MKRFVHYLSLFLLGWGHIALAQEMIEADHVQVRFLMPEVFSVEEETLVAVHFEPDPGWHVYWKNPGDSGSAPKFDIKSKAKLGPILWPAPVRLPIQHLTNLGYEGAVAYLFSVKPQAQEPVLIELDLEWLVCKEECVPGFANVQIKRPTHHAPSKWVDSDLQIVRNFSARVPLPSDQAPFGFEILPVDQEKLRVNLTGLSNSQFERIELYPVNGQFVLPKALHKEPSLHSFDFLLIPGAAKPERLEFVATLDDQSWEFSHVFPEPLSEQTDLWWLVVLGLAGGFLLNLMPCVFPVISMKAFSLLKAEGAARIKDCLLYSLGVLFTFGLLGAIFLLLRHLGASVGWGFQLQSPGVILFLMVLFFLMGLNFLGLFEMGNFITAWTGRVSKSTSSFGTGVLSVFVAAPCTGPFMGTALGAAIVLPPVSSLLVFVSLGLGLASPFLFFATVPKSLSWLPRPGPWMLKLKQLFSIPLFLTVIWLAWVFSQQYSEKKTPASAWIPYSESQLQQARLEGRSVFVDFTAAWCITCQINKQLVLDTEAGQATFKRQNILLMRADWTRYDAAITEALSKLGRSSVPVYAFYPTGQEKPRLLPQVLTLGMIEDLNLVQDHQTGEEK